MTQVKESVRDVRRFVSIPTRVHPMLIISQIMSAQIAAASFIPGRQIRMNTRLLTYLNDLS